MDRILLLFTALFLPLLALAQAEEAPRSLRLVSYNIKHGLGMDGKLDLDRIARVLKELNPDLVALQEIDNQCTRSRKVDQAAALGALLKMESRFGKFMDFQGGEYGLAILSRFPIVTTTRHPLAPGAEPRCALEVVVVPHASQPPVSFVCIHNDWTRDTFRIAQVTDLLTAIGKRKHPVILAGDFNARPGAASLKLISEAGFTFLDKQGAKTFPSDEPKVEIDYLATRGFEFEELPSCTVHDERVASDHRPILTTLPFPATDAGK